VLLVRQPQEVLVHLRLEEQEQPVLQEQRGLRAQQRQEQ
jgi:hypothetical protein